MPGKAVVQLAAGDVRHLVRGTARHLGQRDLRAAGRHQGRPWSPSRTSPTRSSTSAASAARSAPAAGPRRRSARSRSRRRAPTASRPARRRAAARTSRSGRPGRRASCSAPSAPAGSPSPSLLLLLLVEIRRRTRPQPDPSRRLGPLGFAFVGMRRRSGGVRAHAPGTPARATVVSAVPLVTFPQIGEPSYTITLQVNGGPPVASGHRVPPGQEAPARAGRRAARADRTGQREGAGDRLAPTLRECPPRPRKLIGRGVTRIPGLKRLPVMKVLALGEIALLAQRHLSLLTPDERRRLVALVRRARAARATCRRTSARSSPSWSPRRSRAGSPASPPTRSLPCPLPKRLVNGPKRR